MKHKGKIKKQPTEIVYSDYDMPEPRKPKFYSGAKGKCLYYDKECDGCRMNAKCSKHHKYLGDDCQVHCDVHGDSGIGLVV